MYILDRDKIITGYLMTNRGGGKRGGGKYTKSENWIQKTCTSLIGLKFFLPLTLQQFAYLRRNLISNISYSLFISHTYPYKNLTINTQSSYSLYYRYTTKTYRIDDINHGCFAFLIILVFFSCFGRYKWPQFININNWHKLLVLF